MLKMIPVEKSRVNETREIKAYISTFAVQAKKHNYGLTAASSLSPVCATFAKAKSICCRVRCGC